MNKFNLTNEQIRNISIALFGIILIFLGVKYFKPDAPRDDLGQEIVEEEIVGEEEESEVVEEGEVAEPSVESGKPVISDPNKAKFDQALISANTATLAGNHAQAIVYLNQALTYKDSDVVYVRLYSAYNAQGNTAEALKAINKAIELNPSYTDYWNTKIVFMDEKTSASYTELKAVYSDGLAKVDSRTKINLVTSFAGVTERNGETADAISLWEYAKNLYPAGASSYQAEIDRLN